MRHVSPLKHVHYLCKILVDYLIEINNFGPLSLNVTHVNFWFKAEGFLEPSSASKLNA